MRLSNVRIKNFRAIDDLEVEMDPHTVLVGANGVGKSCVLKAIDKFFAASPSVTAEDFHNQNTADPVEITLTFDDLSEEENGVFASRIHQEKLVVSRILIHGAGPRENGRYYGQTPRHAGFAAIRALEGAVPRRQAYNALRQNEPYTTLPQAANDTAVVDGLQNWENENPQSCELSRDDGQFFGFTNVGRGLIQKYASFVFIPAIRDASADSVDKGNTVIGQLIELIVKSVVDKREDIKSWREKASAEYSELVDPKNLGELGGLAGDLTKTLNQFYNDTKVDLDWLKPDEFIVKLPSAAVTLTEQGYTGPVDGKGHGLQRAFIFTILQHLANAVQKESSEPADAAEEKDASHTLILAIEEPELYQHPTKQRHLAKVLADIGRGQIPGVAGRTQVFVCSHSPYFVSTEKFSEVRLARRIPDAEGIKTHCAISQVKSQDVCNILNENLQIPPGKGYAPDSLIARLHILDPLVAEGFFAEKAVLVEGVGDKAALAAVANTMNFSFESEGIAILPVNGKLNIARPWVIFSEFGIPVYTVFDSDRKIKGDDPHVEANLGIQRLCGVANPVDFQTLVGPNFASFDNALEDILQEELGDEFPKHVGLAQQKYGIPQKRLLKSPVSLFEIIAGCLQNGKTIPTISAIVEAIRAL